MNRIARRLSLAILALLASVYLALASVAPLIPYTSDPSTDIAAVNLWIAQKLNPLLTAPAPLIPQPHEQSQFAAEINLWIAQKLNPLLPARAALLPTPVDPSQLIFTFNVWIVGTLNPILSSGGTPPPVNLSPPVITGTPQVGSLLTASASTWTGSPTVTHQWRYHDTLASISGATGSTYTPVTGDIGHTLDILDTATNAGGSVNQASAPTSAVTSGGGGSAPVNTVAPAISSSAATGTPVTGGNGTWTGTPTITFTYQWEYFDTATNISGATAINYTPVSGDVGHTLALKVTGTNGVGNATATSNVTSAVTSGFTPSCSASTSFFSRAATNIAAAVTAGAPGISTWQTTVDTLICGQVTGGTFSLKDVEYYEVAPTIALANMNLVSSSFTQVPGSSMVFTANAGLQGHADLNGFADTGYTPSSGQMTTTSVQMGVCLLNNRTTAQLNTFNSQVGTQVSGNGFVIDILTGGSANENILEIGGGTPALFPISTITTTQGGSFATRQSSTAFFVVNNGTSLGSQASTITTTAGPGDFFVLGLNNAGTPLSPGGMTDTAGVIVLGGGETVTQIQADEVLYQAALHSSGLSSNPC